MGAHMKMAAIFAGIIIAVKMEPIAPIDHPVMYVRVLSTGRFLIAQLTV
jgi:hypothetical protein